MNIRKSIFIGIFLGVFCGANAPVSAAPSFFQWVQSVPVETDLAVPGMAMTADVWLEMVKNAKSTLDLAQFYVSAGSDKGPLEPILVELEKAGNKRGVKIRFLVSTALLKEDPTTLARLRKIKGLTLRTLDLAQVTGGVLHAKYWIVDGKEIFLGSQNFDWRSLNQIHEMGVRVQDKTLVRRLEHIFDLDWRLARTEAPLPPLVHEGFAEGESISKKFELVASPETLNPGEVRSSLRAVIEQVQSAKKSIRIQVLDYSPISEAQVYWPDLDDALRAAALRGVKIQMLVANGSSTRRSLDYLKSLGMIPGVEIKLVTIPRWSGGDVPFARVIHSKYIIFDDESFWLGNSNLGKGYFFNSRNVELIFRNAEWIEPLLAVFNKVWNHSYAEKLAP